MIGMLLLFQVGCKAQGQENKAPLKKMETKQTAEMPRLTVDFQLTADGLEIEYRVKNETSKPIYIFNVPLASGSTDTVAEEKFYSCLRSDGTLLFADFIPPLPRIRSVEFRQIPFATKIEAGASFSEQAVVKLPVVEFNPYFPKGPTSKLEPAESERVAFVLQFIRAVDGLEAKESSVPNAFKVSHKNLFGLVETLNVDGQPLRVKVERRTDSFERF